jgi:hypothetical protein
MAKRLYIQEDNEARNEEALYGPFEKNEILERCNDAFADLMAHGGANIDAISLTDEEASKVYINPRAFWMEQLDTLTE